MVKDLRTTSTHLKLHRYSRLNTSLWGLKNAQPFFPPLEKLFKTETVSSLKEYGVRLGEEVAEVTGVDSIRTTKGNVVPVHRKTTMILSPFKWMRGDYGDLGLPKPETVANDMQEKLQSPHTAAYVGAVASIVLSESGCIHFPKVYGVYVGMAERHTIDISDDYEDLTQRRWFADNLGKTFELKLRTPEHTDGFTHTRSQRPGVILGDEAALDGIEDVDADHVSNPSSSASRASSHSSSVGDTVFDEDTQSDEDDVYEIRSCECMDDEEEGEEEDIPDDDEEPFAWATFMNVPVVTTVMEQCKGTFYDLIEEHPEPHKHAAWVAQIVMALAYAQRNFGFTHNDLHANNVMYVPTDQEYLHYKHNGVAYRVPTYGVLIKIIDFDRAILMLRLTGMKDPRTFVSSQFQPDEEAAGQQNMEPFYDHAHPHIPPSPSFDLCRFATSVFWDMFPEGPDAENTHPLFEVFKQWMMQSDGTSVMFRQERDNHDRYHGFDLYKAIARYCKDAVPRREIQKLTAFQVAQVPLGTQCLFIES
jgi:hypothetical protein